MLQIPDTVEVDVRYDVDNTAIFGSQKFNVFMSTSSTFSIFKLVRTGAKSLTMPGGGRGVMFDVYTLKFSLY